MQVLLEEFRKLPNYRKNKVRLYIWGKYIFRDRCSSSKKDVIKDLMQLQE